MNEYLKKWTYKRLIQLGVGIYFIWDFVETESKFALAFGAIMTIQAVFNIGCFSSKGCATPTDKNTEVHPVAKEIKKVE